MKTPEQIREAVAAYDDMIRLAEEAPVLDEAFFVCICSIREGLAWAAGLPRDWREITPRLIQPSRNIAANKNV